VESLLRFSRTLTTEFLLSTSEEDIRLKRQLIDYACKYAISASTQQDSSAAKRLLNMATTLTGKHRELMSCKVTVLINSAYLKRKMGDAEQALAFLERAELIATKSSEKLDLATVRVNKAAILRTLGLDYRATAELVETAALLEPVIAGAYSRASNADLKRSSWFKKTVTVLLLCNIERLKTMISTGANITSLLSSSLELADKYLKPDNSLSLKLRSFETISRSQSSCSSLYKDTSYHKDTSFQSFSSEETKAGIKVVTESQTSKTIQQRGLRSQNSSQKEEFFERRRSSKQKAIRGRSRLAASADVNKGFDVLGTDKSRKGSISLLENDYFSGTFFEPEVRSMSSTPSSRRGHRLPNTQETLPKLKAQCSEDVPKSKSSSQQSQASSQSKVRKPSKDLSQTLEVKLPSQNWAEEPEHDLSYLLDPTLNYLKLKTTMKCCQVINSEDSRFLLTASLDVGRQIIYIQADDLSASAKSIAPERVQLSEYSSIINLLRIDTVLPRKVLPRFICDFQSFMSYAVLPFIQIQQAKKVLRIEIWEHSRSLLGPVELLFLNAKCFVEVVYVEGQSLRVLINKLQENSKNQVAFDIDLDEHTTRFLLKPIEVPQQGNPNFVRQSFKPIESKHFKQIVNPIRLLEAHLGHYGIGVLETIVGARATLQGPGFSSCLWVVSDDRETSVWKVHFYKGDIKLKLDFSFNQISSSFGVSVDRLIAEERRLLAGYFIDCLKLAKKDMLLVIASELIEEGPQFEARLSSLTKVKMSVIGFDHTVLGIKVQGLTKDSTSVRGIFLPLSSLTSSEPDPIQPSILTHKDIEVETSFEEFVNNFTSLPSLLTQGGWMHIKKSLYEDAEELYLLDARSRKVYIDSLRSVLKLA
jgi:hypothetical protein